MKPSPDELAGVVDGFGALTRAELRTALGDLAARAGAETDGDDIEAAIDDALDAYYLVELAPETALAGPVDDGVDAALLLPGPAALPQLPEGGEDLPHLLELEPRAIDREAAAQSVETELRADAAEAIDSGNADRAELLLDACYEVEIWGPVDLADAKASLATLLD